MVCRNNQIKRLGIALEQVGDHRVDAFNHLRFEVSGVAVMSAQIGRFHIAQHEIVLGQRACQRLRHAYQIRIDAACGAGRVEGVHPNRSRNPADETCLHHGAGAHFVAFGERLQMGATPAPRGKIILAGGSPCSTRALLTGWS